MHAVSAIKRQATQQTAIQKTLNFRQAGEFYRSLAKAEQRDLIANLGGELAKLQNETTLYAMLSHFYKADSNYGTALVTVAKADLQRVVNLAGTLTE